MIEIKRIADVFDVGSSKRVFKSEWTSGGVPFYRAREVVKLSKNGYVDNELYISEEMFQEYSAKYGAPKPGDLLITGVGTLGICYQVKDHDRFYFKDGNIVWLRNKGEVNADYIEYCYKSPFVRRQIESTANAAVVGTYTITNARETKIPLPPLDQQKKIAAILDTADAYRQKTKALIDKYDALTQSLFFDMFGDPVTNPKGWKFTKVDDIATIVRGSSPRPKGDPRYYGEGVPRLMVADLTRDGIFVTPKIDSLTFEGAKKSRPMKQGDLVMAVSGRPGLPAILTVDCCIHDGFAGFRDLKELYDKLFLYYYFLYYIKEVNSRSVGAIFKNITTADIRKIKVPILNSTIQNQFAERIKAIEAQKAQAQASLIQADNLFNSLLQKAFKGELV